MLLKQLIELHKCQESRRGRFAVCPPGLVKRETGLCCTSGCSMMPSWADEAADSGHWHLGMCCPLSYFWFTFFFPWKQCSRYLTAPWSPLPADLCEDSSSPCTSCRCWTPHALLWSLSVLPSAAHTHTPSQPDINTLSCLFCTWVQKQLQRLKVFTHLAEGRRYTNSADLSSSCETNPSELQHESLAKLFY